MTPGRVLAVLAALVLLGLGVAIGGAGMGWYGGGESRAWAVLGALFAGLGVAIPISMVQLARQQRHVTDLQRERYGRGR